jgi:uncharacterized protein (DUF1501 family)
MRRRSFLIKGTSLLALGSALPPVLGRSAFAGALDRVNAATAMKTLVVVELNGGIDGLNVVIPLNNSAYQAARPNLNVVEATAVPLGSGFGLHAALAPLKTLAWDTGRMAIVHGVGNLTPNLSHFSSQKIWYTADPTSQQYEGWLGRYLNEVVVTNEPFAGVAASSAVPVSLRSNTVTSAAIASVSSYQLQSSYGSTADANLRRAKVPLNYAAYPTVEPWGALLQSTSASATATSAAVLAGSPYTPAPGVTYPASGLGNGLKLIAQLITSDLGVRVAYISTGGWDTHSDQLPTMQTLLTGLNDSLAAFYSDLSAKGYLNNILIMTTSEFGRRVRENGAPGSGVYGTDHGTSNFQLFLGGAVRGGFYGSFPSLTNLDSSGNPVSSTDFRATYATAIGSWLGADPAAVLGGTFATLPLIGSVAAPQIRLPFVLR